MAGRSQAKISAKITPFLWFDDQAEAAAAFYVSLFADSRVTDVARYSEAAAAVAGRPAGSAMTVAFELAGQPFVALNGGPAFKFSEAISFLVTCESQAEIDDLWGKLADGGEEQPCGWLKDRYGLSWQIVPANLGQLISGADPARSERAIQALLGMKKLDIAALERAYGLAGERAS
jgi:predicted 3-demethylubiquinone-9 3-methyltransferase (glyoxalase superfamily)